MNTDHANQLPAKADEFPPRGPLAGFVERRLEILQARFGALQVIASASLLLAEADRLETCPPMDSPTALAVLTFADDLADTRAAVTDRVSSLQR